MLNSRATTASALAFAPAKLANLMSFLRRFSVSLGFLPPLLLLLVGIGAFGIWDPWELNIADEARAMSEGTVSEEVQRNAPLARAVIAQSFSMFGVSEQSGRLPMAFAGFLLLLAAFFAGRRFDSKRAGLYAAAVLASTPIVLLNSRGMFGDAFAMAANAFVGLCACQLAFGKAKVPEAQKKHLVLWGLGLVAAIGFAFVAAGALSGIVPPLAAVAVVSALRIGSTDDALQKKTLIGLAVLGAAVTAKTGWDINADAASYSAWLGGAPFGGEPPTFDSALERVFHGFGPWAGLMVLALARLLAPASLTAAKEAKEGDEADAAPDGDTFHFRVTLLLWAAFGYGALMLYTARYGQSTFHSVAPVGIAIALFLRDMERSGRSWWGEAVVASLLVVLVLRDYALFPGTSVDSLPVLDLTTPEVFNPRSKWAGFLLLFLVVQGLGFISGNEFREKPDWKAPYKFLSARWNEGREPFAKKWQLALFVLFWPFIALALLFSLGRIRVEAVVKAFKTLSPNRAWMSLGGTLLFVMALFGGACFALGDALPLTSIAIRAGRRLLFVPLAIPVLIAGGQMALWLYSRLDGRRALPVLAAGLAVGAYTSFGFLPALSAHFSPRAVYDTYNELHADGEPLGEYRVSGRAAAYYADGEAENIESQAQLLEFLTGEQRAWAVIPTDQLATVNRAFRSETRRHLFVADAENARLVLITGEDVAGRENQSFIANSVFFDAPEPEFPVDGQFDDKIGLVGYDLETPQPGYVGAGQEFTIVWHWKALRSIPGSYQIFLHIDGEGNRLNGDHEPLEGRYPIRLWDEGDIVLDRQTLTVPANYRPGAYTLWIGFFSGNNRLSVTRGVKDNVNRINAGTIRVQ